MAKVTIYADLSPTKERPFGGTSQVFPPAGEGEANALTSARMVELFDTSAFFVTAWPIRGRDELGIALTIPESGGAVNFVQIGADGLKANVLSQNPKALELVAAEVAQYYDDPAKPELPITVFICDY
ncbi:hypothetical protein A2160_01855 [Candidatus Beckwithbacteria bacterium RBG_13_42_9]|uniref:Uncharacterized protein n=1 Tax=Candidatus Beckwithbacteria bacterium RBG_13_42_9 TaxID=1797457 RepID=A0A1F5E8A0_9BACT|nr:MAG: hypothetical protein A2160_01855 [Candidatus Beckwithbacteria bacterium RBG_13_42_9]